MELGLVAISEKRKMTTDKIRDKIFELVGDEYTLISEYINYQTKVDIIHNKCEHIYKVKYGNFIHNNRRCPKCFGTPKKNTEQFRYEVYKLTNGEYDVMGEYKTNSTKIRLKHNNISCEFHEYETEPKNFLSGTRCPKCFGTTKKTYTYFISKVKELVGNEYSVIENVYLGTNTPIRMKHNKRDCEFHEWDVSPRSFIHNGTRCPKCAGKMRKSYEEFISQVYKITGDEYSVIGEAYINAKTSIKMKHNNIMCNFYEYNVLPNNFLRGKRCPKCSGLMKKTHEEFCLEVRELVGNEYYSLDKYMNAKTHIKMKHSICGHEYHVTPSHFLNGRRCPKCFGSKGEKRVSNYLEKNKFEFESQYQFNDLTSKKGYCLRFDFAVFENEELICFIEYDGEFHFKKIFENDGHEQIKKHDQLKNEYCQRNNIKLIRISYTESENLEEILKNELLCAS